IVIAKSERLYLTPLHVTHAPYFVKWYNDPEIFGHIRDMDRMTTLDEQIRWVQETHRDPNQRIFSIFYRPDDQMVGDGGLMHINWQDKKAEVGFGIGESKYKGKRRGGG